MLVNVPSTLFIYICICKTGKEYLLNPFISFSAEYVVERETDRDRSKHR